MKNLKHNFLQITDENLQYSNTIYTDKFLTQLKDYLYNYFNLNNKQYIFILDVYIDEQTEQNDPNITHLIFEFLENDVNYITITQNYDIVEIFKNEKLKNNFIDTTNADNYFLFENNIFQFFEQ